jgi:VanZ family protein
MLKFLNQYKKTAGFLVLIFVLCLSPSPEVTKKLGWTVSFGFDKWVHAGLYFFLFLIWSTESKQFHKSVVYFVCTATVVGAGIELLQKIAPFHRSAELADFFADISGIFFGYFVVDQQRLRKSNSGSQ